jgi:hypothetical protein
VGETFDSEDDVALIQIKPVRWALPFQPNPDACQQWWMPCEQCDLTMVISVDDNRQVWLTVAISA